MDLGGMGWVLQTVIGVALLAGVLLWAMLRNRQSSVSRDVTEKETRALYKEEEAHRDTAGDDVP